MTINHNISLCAFTALTLGMLDTASFAQRSYQLTPLPKPVPASYISAYAIDSRGSVAVVTSDVSDFGEVWLLGESLRKPYPALSGALGAQPIRLLESGRMVGSSGNDLFDCVGVVWTPEGVARELEAAPGAMTTLAYDGDDAGWIVGGSGTFGSGVPAIQPMLWSAGSAVPLDLPLGLTFGYASAINRARLIVGAGWNDDQSVWRGWLRHGLAAPSLVPIAPGHTANGLEDVNRYGVAAGFSYDGTTFTQHGLLFDSHSGTQLLVAPPPGIVSLTLTRLNNEGQAVGNGYDITTFQSEAVFVENGVSVRLDSLLDGSATGWNVSWAAGINDAGEIAVTAIDPNGRTFACILRPTVHRAPSAGR